MPVCVFNTLVLYQVLGTVCRRLESLLRGRMVDRSIHWLTGPPELDGSESVGLEWVRRADGELRRDRLVEFEPHGAWLSWEA